MVLLKTAAVSAQVLCTPYNHAPCHLQSHICKVYAYLAVTCHLHFWQNDRDLLRAIAVIQGWNRYWNKSQHRKSTLEKKIFPLLLQGFEPATFQSRVRCSLTTELFPDQQWARIEPGPSTLQNTVLVQCQTTQSSCSVCFFLWLLSFCGPWLSQTKWGDFH